MNIRKYMHYVGTIVLGIVLILNYMEFVSYYSELSDTDEDFIYIYTDSDLPVGIVEECHKYQIDCELWKKESKISLAVVKGVDALSYQETEHLFSDSDCVLDVNLLKWMVYLIAFFCSLIIIIFCLCKNKKCGKKKWFYFVVFLIWFLYIKIFLFAGMADFPVWSLPGKWSDLEGWRGLGEDMGKQILYIVQFKDYPTICRYYEGVVLSIFYLLITFKIDIFLNRRYNISESEDYITIRGRKYEIRNGSFRHGE